MAQEEEEVDDVVGVQRHTSSGGGGHRRGDCVITMKHVPLSPSVDNIAINQCFGHKHREGVLGYYDV